MKKIIAVISLVVVFLIGVLVAVSVISEDFRNSVATSVEGSLLAPIDVGVTNGWMDIGRSGFTFIAATAFILYVSGIFSGYAWSHWLRPKIPWGLDTDETRRDYTPQTEPSEPEPVIHKSEPETIAT